MVAYTRVEPSKAIHEVLQVVLLQEWTHRIVGRSETFQNDSDE